MSSVDIIVPCYGYGHFLRECVESVLRQSSPEWRVLIIDDASPDNTAEIAAELVRSDRRVDYCRHTFNQGLIATANEGIAWARADYMVLLSADDYLLPNSLARSVDLLDNHPSVAFVFGRAVVLGQRGERSRHNTCVGTETQILSGLDFIALNRAQNIVRSPTVVVRTSLQKQVGGYLAHLPHTSDMEMWLRLAAHGDVGVIAADQAAVIAFGPDGTRLGVFATGIRNCVGLAIHPANGDLYCSTNERDGLGDNLVPDYITRVHEGACYGWPWFYIGGNEDPRHTGKRAELKGRIAIPDVLIQAHSASLGLTFYNGNMFPAEYTGDGFCRRTWILESIQTHRL